MGAVFFNMYLSFFVVVVGAIFSNVQLHFVKGSGSEDQLYIRFMESRCCYEAMPYSTKLVVFDTQLNVS